MMVLFFLPSAIVPYNFFSGFLTNSILYLVINDEWIIFCVCLHLFILVRIRTNNLVIHVHVTTVRGTCHIKSGIEITGISL